MRKHSPNGWVILRISGSDERTTTHYRIFGCWFGGFLDSDEWRMNSGIVKAEQDENGFLNFFAASGSCYRVHSNSYGNLTMYCQGVLNDLIEKISQDEHVSATVLENNHDWVTFDWIIS